MNIKKFTAAALIGLSSVACTSNSTKERALENLAVETGTRATYIKSGKTHYLNFFDGFLPSENGEQPTKFMVGKESINGQVNYLLVQHIDKSHILIVRDLNSDGTADETLYRELREGTLEEVLLLLARDPAPSEIMTSSFGQEVLDASLDKLYVDFIK